MINSPIIKNALCVFYLVSAVFISIMCKGLLMGLLIFAACVVKLKEVLMYIYLDKNTFIAEIARGKGSDDVYARYPLVAYYMTMAFVIIVFFKSFVIILNYILDVMLEHFDMILQ